jgi:SAM-dependent methyltransferase
MSNNYQEVETIRQDFIEGKRPNLSNLLQKRYEWILPHLDLEADSILEVGTGIGVTPFFIPAKKLNITDVCPFNWVHSTLDANQLEDLEENSYNAVIAINVLHHLAYPLKFLNACAKILPSGGRLFLVESHCGFLLKLLINITQSEMYDYKVNPFDFNTPVKNPEDPTEGNNAIGNLFFQKTKRFEEKVLEFKVMKRSYQEFLQFLISGGASRSFPTIEFPIPILKMINKFDEQIIQIFRPLALSQYIILERI